MTIDLDKQDLMVKFSNGSIHSEDGFRMKGERLFLPNGTPTPFEVKVSGNTMLLTIVDSGQKYQFSRSES